MEPKANYLSKKGARTLAQKIQDYWVMRGYRVEVRLYPDPNIPAINARYDVRSNLVDGWPKTQKAA